MILTVLTLLVGVLGALLLSFGAWMVFPPAGFIVGGLLCLMWSWWVAKVAAELNIKIKGGG